MLKFHGMSKYRARNAFTIIESVIAMLILGIMMAGGINFFILASKHAAENTHKKTALRLADSWMETLRSGTVPIANSAVPALAIDDLPAAAGSGTTTVANVAGQTYKLVTVTVTWNEPGLTTPQQVVLQTYI